MAKPVIEVENISKLYRLGEIGLGTFRELFENWSNRLSGKKVPNFTRSATKPLFDVTQRGSKPSTFWALKDVSLSVNEGEIVGLIGRNGAGKSTLLKVLSRITDPTSGKATLRGRVASLLEVGTGFHPELTGRENIYLNGSVLGMRKKEIDKKFDEIVDFSELEEFLDTPVKRYSSGMYMRLGFAVAAHLEQEILLVDEVLAVGDAGFQKKCLGKIRNVSQMGRTVIFVSHNMAAIRQLCIKGFVFEKGRCVYQGRSEDALAFYQKFIYGEGLAGQGPGVLYVNPDAEVSEQRPFVVSRVEVLDNYNKPKPTLSTWDSVKFRVHYEAMHLIKNGAAVLKILTLEDVVLLSCSTRSNQKTTMVIEAGKHHFDCFFEKWPLSGGDYLLKAGLAIPMQGWLCETQADILVHTMENHVFSSGVFPEDTPYTLACSYQIIPGS